MNDSFLAPDKFIEVANSFMGGPLLEEVTRKDFVSELSKRIDKELIPGKMMRVRHSHYSFQTNRSEDLCEVESIARRIVEEFSITGCIFQHSLVTGDLLIERVRPSKGLPNGVLRAGLFEGAEPK